MKTAIIGGGKGSRAILEMVEQERLQLLNPEIIAVVDPNPDAPGVIFARQQGWTTLTSVAEALELPGLELVIELTGKDSVLEELYRLIPPGVRVMDHVLAEVFWDLDNVMFQLSHELAMKTEFENQLRRDRNQLQQILDSLPDAVLVVNRHMNLERVNARFTAVTGIEPIDLIGRKCIDPFCRKKHGDKCEEGACALEEVMREKNPIHMVQVEEKDDGTESYYEITINPIFDEKGNICRLVETARQITEQVMLKRETEESEQRFRQFIQNLHEMVTMKDVGGRYLVINPPAAEIFGMRPEDFLGKTDFDVFPRKIAGPMAAKDKQVILDGEYQRVEEKLKIKGELFYLDTVRFPLLDYKGDISGVCSIARDITEQKHLQRAIVQSEKLAAVGKLAAGVAHELNNPLTGILTFAEEMKMDLEAENPMVEDLDTIVRETMRCRQIVRDLLDYARIEKPQRRRKNINTVIERSLSLVRKQAAFHNVEFDLELAADLPDVNIDPGQMQQVFLNLIINAAEAMNNEGIINIRSRVADEGHAVEVEVEDRGHGIPADKLQQIFEPFFSTKGQQGNGLGLNVIQGIVEQHGGNVHVTSEVGVGSSFRVTLPVVRDENRKVTND